MRTEGMAGSGAGGKIEKWKVNGREEGLTAKPPATAAQLEDREEHRHHDAADHDTEEYG